MMTNGELLYLLLVLAAFGVFMAVLAHLARQYRHARDVVTTPDKPAVAPPLAEESHAR